MKVHVLETVGPIYGPEAHFGILPSVLSEDLKEDDEIMVFLQIDGSKRGIFVIYIGDFGFYQVSMDDEFVDRLISSLFLDIVSPFEVEEHTIH